MSDPTPPTPPAPSPGPDPAPSASPTPSAPVPVAPQAGIRNRPPEHVIVAAFALPADAAAAADAVRALRALEGEELASRLPVENAATPKSAPGPETGELGFDDGFDRAHLTITTGFASTAFDKLGVTPDQRPQDLIEIPWSLLGDTPTQPNQGDVVVQVCSDDPYICEHVIHRATYEVSGLTLIWSQIGVQRYTSRAGRTNRREGRALNGFIDGTSNLDLSGGTPDDDTLVFIDPTAVASYPTLPQNPQPVYGQPAGPTFPGDLRNPPASEPDWTRWGSYMVVRSVLLDFGAWDTTTLDTQEKTIGRFKYSGAFLDLTDDETQLNNPPAFAADQTNQKVPPNAHVRRANPRGPDDAPRRIFRRGYPLIEASTTGIDRGLLFIAYGRTITTQFEFIFRGWMRNPNFPTAGAGIDQLFNFEKEVVTGGYYFVPPITHPRRPASWNLPGL